LSGEPVISIPCPGHDVFPRKAMERASIQRRILSHFPTNIG
jgi:hypothetical protein